MTTRLKLWWHALALTALLGAGATPANAGTLAPDLQAQVDAAPLSLRPVRVIVQLSNTGLTGALLALLYGGTYLGQLDLIDGVVLTVPLSVLPALSLNLGVASVSSDLPLSARGDYDAEATGAAQVWAAPGARGTNVRVAVIDSGVNAATSEWSSAGGTRLVAFKDFVNGRTTPYDDNGHGTHVAGIILGGGVQSQGAVAGTAPGADLVAVKVLGSDGSAWTSTVIRGIDWCVKQRSALNLRVINLSLGHRPTESYRTDPLCKAVRKAVNAGLVVVCSAGNSGKDEAGNLQFGGIDSPANEPSAITVGALNTFGTPGREDDAVCSYSSRGPTVFDGLPKPDLVAPGNRIVSVRAPGSYLDTAYPDNRVRYQATASAPEYFELSGTSMAAPQVAGIAALMLQVNPGLAPNAIKAVLMYTAQRLTVTDGAGVPLPFTQSVLSQGAGSVNAVGAVQLALQLNASAPAGSVWCTSPVNPQSSVAGSTFAWTQQVLWGSQWVRGADVLAIRQPRLSGVSGWGDPNQWLGSVSACDYNDGETGTGTGGTTDGGTGGTTGSGTESGPVENTDPPPPPPDDAQITWSDSGPIRGE